MTFCSSWWFVRRAPHQNRSSISKSKCSNSLVPTLVSKGTSIHSQAGSLSKRQSSPAPPVLAAAQLLQGLLGLLGLGQGLDAIAHHERKLGHLCQGTALRKEWNFRLTKTSTSCRSCDQLSLERPGDRPIDHSLAVLVRTCANKTERLVLHTPYEVLVAPTCAPTCAPTVCGNLEPTCAPLSADLLPHYLLHSAFLPLHLSPSQIAMTARCLVDLVASGHHQRRQGAGGQGAGHGVTLLGDVHLGVVGRLESEWHEFPTNHAIFALAGSHLVSHPIHHIHEFQPLHHMLLVSFSPVYYIYIYILCLSTTQSLPVRVQHSAAERRGGANGARWWWG